MNRRDMFRGVGGGLMAAGLAGRAPAKAATRGGGPNIYEKIGVRPLINCKGTFTIISGSLTLPEVKEAMDEASRHYVHLDELMDAVGQRLAELTKAEWGIITAGCAAAATHATAACIAGNNPEKMQRLPTDLAGLKDEVVMPRQSRNVYDHAIRMLGVKMITPETREQFLTSFGPKTAMLAILGEALDHHPMQLEEMVQVAHQHGVPVFVDAAAERLTIPNVYLGKGVDMVAYSGGKCLRGPQCAGLLLGKKDLLQAAWSNSAPHHAFGRSLKVGKEEIMGMLAAVDMWTKRDHDAEWKQWERWLATFQEKLASLPGVTTQVHQPRGPSNYAPTLRISWDPEKLGANATEVQDALLAGNPRVILSGYGNALSIMPYMMMPGDDKIASERLYEVLKNPPRHEKPAVTPSNAALTGQWDVQIDFIRGEANHSLWLEEKNGKVVGQHRGEFLSGDVRGTREGNRVSLRSVHRYQGTALTYHFEGTLGENTMSGTVDLGEYGKTRFEAKQHWV
ncbi:MAG TPA: aminotransferase class V-fold PLP-dependent enzyme [Bryobacteraceae bacterium]|nr:aminotransferase class V-fold PLP-dependent enzyme [Bryobacteraceae bacterium]